MIGFCPVSSTSLPRGRRRRRPTNRIITEIRGSDLRDNRGDGWSEPRAGLGSGEACDPSIETMILTNQSTCVFAAHKASVTRRPASAAIGSVSHGAPAATAALL